MNLINLLGSDFMRVAKAWFLSQGAVYVASGTVIINDL